MNILITTKKAETKSLPSTVSEHFWQNIDGDNWIVLSEIVDCHNIKNRGIKVVVGEHGASLVQ